VLSGEGLRLRPWTLDDAPAVLSLIDDVTRRWSPSLRVVTTTEQATGWLRGRMDPTHWVVTDAGDGTVLGRVSLLNHSVEDRSAEVGYGVVPAHRGRGVARRAVAVVLRHAFGPQPHGLSLIRVQLLHAVGNAASCRVAAVSGFAYEGLLRRAIPAGDGAFDDAHVHARLVDDPPGPVPVTNPPIEPTELVAGAFQLCIPNGAIDADAVLAACQDPEIARWNSGPVDVAAARDWCTSRADWSDGTHASWLVKDTAGTLLGQISLFQIDRRASAAQLGYWVVPGARLRGVASSAVDAVRGFAFGALGLERLELYHAVENEGSCAVARRAGFRHEGTHRSSYRYGDGLLHDEHSHARLATDP
jgi:RimJ/RimL family protein N-acetyltransferase